MEVQLLWAGVTLLLGGAVIWRADRSLRKIFGLHEAEKQAALEERQAVAAFAAATATARAEFEKAELLRRAAEERTRAVVAEMPETVQARLDEELAIIAARQDARVRATKENGYVEDDEARMEVLQRGYLPYLETQLISFSAWLGNAELGGYSLTALDRLMNLYLTYIETQLMPFGAWLGKIKHDQLGA